MDAPPDLPGAAREATVVHVDAESGFSGGEVQVLHHIRGLDRLGWRQLLVAPPSSELLDAVRAVEFQAALGRPLELRELRMRNSMDLGALFGLRRILRAACARGPVVLQLHTGRATWLGALASVGLGLVVVSTRRMDRRVKRGLRTRLILGRLVDRTVAISGPVRAALQAAGVPPDRLVEIPDSVEPAELRVQDPGAVRVQVRRELSLAADDFVLLVLARLDHRKGVDVLLAAIGLLRTEAGMDALRERNALAARAARLGEGRLSAERVPVAGRTPVLLVAGDGPERGRLEEQIERLGLGDSVRLLGQRADKARLLAAADAFALPSRREGLGVAALEAMAAGRAVIASRVGGLGQAVVDGKTGLLVEAENEAALAQAITRLVRNPNLTARLGMGGQARIDEVYRVEAMVAAYSALYLALLTESAACENQEPKP